MTCPRALSCAAAATVMACIAPSCTAAYRQNSAAEMRLAQIVPGPPQNRVLRDRQPIKIASSRSGRLHARDRPFVRIEPPLQLLRVENQQDEFIKFAPRGDKRQVQNARSRCEQLFAGQHTVCEPDRLRALRPPDTEKRAVPDPGQPRRLPIALAIERDQLHRVDMPLEQPSGREIGTPDRRKCLQQPGGALRKMREPVTTGLDRRACREEPGPAQDLDLRCHGGLVLTRRRQGDDFRFRPDDASVEVMRDAFFASHRAILCHSSNPGSTHLVTNASSPTRSRSRSLARSLGPSIAGRLRVSLPRSTACQTHRKVERSRNS